MHRRPASIDIARASASPASRCTARTPPRCCATPTSRCTPPSAAMPASRSTTRRARARDGAALAAGASCAARWSTTSCVLLYQPKIDLATAGCPASRRWCAGSTRRAASSRPCTSFRSPSRPATSAITRWVIDAASPVRSLAPRLAHGTDLASTSRRATCAAPSSPRMVAAALGATAAAAAALPRDHRERPDARPGRAHRRAAALRGAGRGPRSTISAPATRRSPTSSSCRCTS